MSLPEWCQTHSLKDFFLLMKDYNKINSSLGSINDEPNKNNKGNVMNDVSNTELAPIPVDGAATDAGETPIFVQTPVENGDETQPVD